MTFTCRINEDIIINWNKIRNIKDKRYCYHVVWRITITYHENKLIVNEKKDGEKKDERND